MEQELLLQRCPTNTEISLSVVWQLAETQLSYWGSTGKELVEDSTSIEEQGGCKFICFKDKDKGEGECDLSLGYGRKAGKKSSAGKKKKGQSFSFAQSSASNYKCWRDQCLLVVSPYSSLCYLVSLGSVGARVNSAGLSCSNPAHSPQKGLFQRTSSWSASGNWAFIMFYLVEVYLRACTSLSR